MLLNKFAILSFVLALCCSNILSQTPYTFPGFPKIFDNERSPDSRSGMPVAADLDNDGNKEIIAASFDYLSISQIMAMLHVIKIDGNEMQGFPKAYYQRIFGVAAGDINDDGYIDIALRLEDTIDVVDRTGNHLPGFPVFYRTIQSQSNWVPSNFINLYDLDNDGKIEIITGQYGAMAVFDFHGQFKSGWPKPIVGRVFSTPAIGDLDKDGKAEIVSAQFKEIFGQPSIDSPSINILRFDGSAFNNNWPKYHDSLYHTFTSSPSIYIGATASESYIISAISKYTNYPSSDIKYIKYNINGVNLNSIHYFYPTAVNEQTMVMGDVNRDGILEYSASFIGDLYLFSSNFTVMSGWPQLGSQGQFLTPVLAKVKYGSELSILTPGPQTDSNGGFIYAYDKLGSPLSWSPLRPIGAILGVCVADLNNDGSVEIITTNARLITTFHINIWTIPGIAFNHNNFPWPQFCHDRYKSNQYGFIPPDEPIGIKPISNEMPDKFSLYQNYPNPFNPKSNIKFQISKLSEVKLVIFDILGREIAVLVNERLNAGTYEAEWDASNYTSGVYFYKLITDGYTETKKMVLIK